MQRPAPFAAALLPSISRAEASAWSRVTVIKAFRLGLSFSIRPRQASVNSTGEVDLFLRRMPACFTVRLAGSCGSPRAILSTVAVKPAVRNVLRVGFTIVVYIVRSTE
jgi:hypothetical protein